MNTPKTDSVTKPIAVASNDPLYAQVVPAHICREIERDYLAQIEAMRTAIKMRTLTAEIYNNVKRHDELYG